MYLIDMESIKKERDKKLRRTNTRSKSSSRLSKLGNFSLRNIFRRTERGSMLS